MTKYKMLKKGKKMGISLATLFESLQENKRQKEVTTDQGHTIVKTKENGSEYFDLDNGNTSYACCDGEECTVESVNGDVVTFRNGDETFELTVAECETCIFGLK